MLAEIADASEKLEKCEFRPVLGYAFETRSDGGVLCAAIASSSEGTLTDEGDQGGGGSLIGGSPGATLALRSPGPSMPLRRLFWIEGCSAS